MPTYTTTFLRESGALYLASRSFDRLIKEAMLKSAADIAGFDIFLSHSSTDKNLIYGIYRELTETFNKDVYVDWLIDPQLDRELLSIVV